SIDDATGAVDARWATASDDVRLAAIEALTRRAVACVLRLDGPGVGAHAELARAWTRPGDDRLTHLRVEYAQSWCALVDGRPVADDRLANLEREARGLGCAELVVDGASLRALSLAQVGAFVEALECARRASRMGRTERLPQSEYLAGIVLARLRRLTGRPHLATRILSALRGFAPRLWHDWIDWEITMASGVTPPAATGPGVGLGRVLHRAGDGDRGQFVAAVAELRTRVAEVAPLACDLQRTQLALDPESDPAAADPAIARWCSGESAFTPAPYGLAGLNGPRIEEGAAVGGAVVIAWPGRPGRRVLRAVQGLAFALTADRWLADQSVGRTEGLVSALALLRHGGTDDEALFRSVYGFAYSPSLHRGTFDVALHRARGRVEPFGHIVRKTGQVCLEVVRSFVVPDPRSTPGPDSRVLGHLARAGQLSARELAQTLGIPLRTVQGALRGLVEGGACHQHRVGRRVVYAIEDTTFQAPTFAGKPS
ncbi:MAG: helix-turn-helix transcriptional regulator, partial [Nannocystaceae bacterium]|nr:helix-turn-helix transcriptional regulator [Nannocystaceae bacterium]